MLSPSCPEETGAQGGLSDLPAGVQWWSWVGSLAGSPGLDLDFLHRSCGLHELRDSSHQAQGRNEAPEKGQVW